MGQFKVDMTSYQLFQSQFSRFYQIMQRFDGIGKLKDFQVKLNIDPSVTQVSVNYLTIPYIRLPINKAAAAVCQLLPTAISGSRLCTVFCQWHKYSGKLGQKAVQN